MQKANWYKCSDHLAPGEHEMRDYCWNCAPFWDNVPICPLGHGKLSGEGRKIEVKKVFPSGESIMRKEVAALFCKKCRKFYNTRKEAEVAVRV